MDSNYRIVIPSRKRTGILQEKSLKVFPNATIVVRSDELEDYKAITKNVVSLPANFQGGMGSIRQWCLDNFKEQVIVFCDDDLINARCLVGMRNRVIDDPESVLRIVENGINILQDLNVGLFYWQRNPRPEILNLGDFLGCSGGFAAGIFCVNGRHLRFDKVLVTREDVDLTMTALLIDRYCMSDKRFYFDFGDVWKGKGGNQIIRTSEAELKDKQYLFKKWGSLLELDAKIHGFATSKSVKKGARNTVIRKNPLATQ